jgi:hypothetical protein
VLLWPAAFATAIADWVLELEQRLAEKEIKPRGAAGRGREEILGGPIVVNPAIGRLTSNESSLLDSATARARSNIKILNKMLTAEPQAEFRRAIVESIADEKAIWWDQVRGMFARLHQTQVPPS